MSIHSVEQVEFAFLGSLPVRVEVVEEQLSSDAGLLPLRQFDERLGWTEEFAAQIRDGRQGHTHAVVEMVRQRVFGILAGYEDQNDHDTLRSDGVFKLVAAAPTIPRFLQNHPSVQLVITHLGNPQLRDGRLAETELLRLAALPGVFVQLSGLSQFCQYPYAELHDFILAIIREFGAPRVYWGSNYPVCGGAAEYCRDLLQVTYGGGGFDRQSDSVDYHWDRGTTVVRIGRNHGLIDLILNRLEAAVDARPCLHSRLLIIVLLRASPG